MPYKISYGPRNRIPAVKKKTVSEDTAAAAWMLVQQLHASDEETEITTPSGQSISWQELRSLAEKEAN